MSLINSHFGSLVEVCGHYSFCLINVSNLELKTRLHSILPSMELLYKIATTKDVSLFKDNVDVMRANIETLIKWIRIYGDESLKRALDGNRFDSYSAHLVFAGKAPWPRDFEFSMVLNAIACCTVVFDDINRII